MSSEKAILYPITATFVVVKNGNKKKLQLLREQDKNGVIRTGAQICSKGRNSFSLLNAELFAGKSRPAHRSCVYIHVYVVSKESLILSHKGIMTVVELGGHYNGQHFVCRNHFRAGNSYDGWIEAKWFEVGEIIVISGYCEELAKDSLSDKLFAKK